MQQPKDEQGADADDATGGAIFGSFFGGLIASARGPAADLLPISLGAFAPELRVVRPARPAAPVVSTVRVPPRPGRRDLLRLAAAVPAGAVPDAGTGDRGGHVVQHRPRRRRGRVLSAGAPGGAVRRRLRAHRPVRAGSSTSSAWGSSGWHRPGRRRASGRDDHARSHPGPDGPGRLGGRPRGGAGPGADDRRRPPPRRAVLARALDVGVNWIDTAAGYGDGRSEAGIGRALRNWVRRARSTSRRRCG